MTEPQATANPRARNKRPCASFPIDYLLEFFRHLHDQRDRIQVITYNDLPWEDDWDYSNNYPAEFDRWSAAVRRGTLDPDKAYVLIQHDVDARPALTHDVLREEERLGIRSNVMIFNRCVNRRMLKSEGHLAFKDYLIDVAELQRLEQQGFVIGYHSNAYEQAQFDAAKGLGIFTRDVADLRRQFQIDYFCPHGGVRDANGQSNAVLEIPESLRHSIRWTLNRHGPRFHAAYSDGGINSLKYDATKRDLHAFAKSLEPGKRYRILIHPQYYARDFSPSRRLTGVAWYDDLMVKHSASQSRPANDDGSAAQNNDRPRVRPKRPHPLHTAPSETHAARSLPGRPIFIGGDGRSGTTLVNVILDSHPDLAVGPELHFNGPANLGPEILRSIDILMGDSAKRIESDLDGHEAIKPAIQFVRRVERAGIEIDSIKTLIEKAMAETGSDLVSFDDRCVLIHEFGQWLCRKSGKSRYGFKIMKEIKNLQQYSRIWPGAQFIHIIRDGRDVAASQMLEHGSWGYADIKTAAQGWVRVIEKSRRHSRGVSVIEVRYEDLVTNPEPTLRRMLEFLGATWNDAVLQHNRVDHLFYETSVHHPSRKATQQPINNKAIGRFRRELTAEQISLFESIARQQLSAFGYLEEPESASGNLHPASDVADSSKESTAAAAVGVSHVRMNLGSNGCVGSKPCKRMVANVQERLVGRFLVVDAPQPDQVEVAWIGLQDLTWDSYLGDVKRRYKGNVVRDARKSDKQGYVCKPFPRLLHVPDIVDINHSKDERCGKPMREEYLKNVKEMGGEPTSNLQLKPPECPCHYDMWWGVFEPRSGYAQGTIVTNERLIAYINFRRIGTLSLYSLILGHGDFLQHGIMYRLHFEIMQWILRRDEPATCGLDGLMYAGFHQGTDGLQLWKKKTAFEPRHLVVDDLDRLDHRPTASLAIEPVNIWRRLRNLVK